MKKTKILAWIMLCAILLSSIMIPVSATESESGSDTATNTATNTGAETITIDGKADEAVWGTTTATYTLGLQVDTPVNASSTREDATPSTAKFTYDSEYLYLCFQTTNPSRGSYHSINVQLRPEGKSLSAGSGSANGEKLFLKVRLAKANTTDCVETEEGSGTFIWKGSNPSENIALIDKFGFNKDAGNDNANATNNYTIGDGYYDKTEIAVTVTVDEETGVATKTMEVKFPLADSYKAALRTMAGANLQVGFWELTGYSGSDVDGEGATNASNGGYIVDATNYGWNGESSKGALLNLPMLRVAEPTFGKTITVDGQMGEDEGWSTDPMLQTSIYASSNKLTDQTTVKQEDTSPTTIRISCDGEKVYFFIEITHEDTLSAYKRKVDGSNQAAALILHFYPDNDEARSGYGTDNGQWFTLALSTSVLNALADEKFDANGTYIWDMVEDGACTGSDSAFFWRFLYGSESSMKYSESFCQSGVALAAHLDKDEDGNRTKLSVEFAFPLAQNVVTALENGNVPYKVAYYERNNFYKDLTQENSDEIVSLDAGFYINETATPVETRLKKDTDDPGVSVILKQNTEGVYAAYEKWLEDYKASAECNNLENITVNLFGDDYLTGGSLATYYRWISMMTEIYDWTINDYNQAGVMTSTYDNIQLYPLCRSYLNMGVNDVPDVVLVSGGLNDYLNGVPIGTVTDTDTNTYMGALNRLIDSLRKTYPDACLVFTTVYNFTGSIEGSTLTSADYANAMKAVCEAKDVYCFYAYDTTVSGIDMSSDTFRAEYCLTADDTVNLNFEGMKLILPKYEKFISESLTHWAANKDQILADWQASQNANNGNTNNGNTDNGNTDNGNTDNGSTNNGNTDNGTTPAPTEPAEKKGCGSVIGVSSALAMLAIISCAGAVCIKKHD